MTGHCFIQYQSYGNVVYSFANWFIDNGPRATWWCPQIFSSSSPSRVMDKKANIFISRKPASDAKLAQERKPPFLFLILVAHFMLF